MRDGKTLRVTPVIERNIISLLFPLSVQQKKRQHERRKLLGPKYTSIRTSFNGWPGIAFDLRVINTHSVPGEI